MKMTSKNNSKSSNISTMRYLTMIVALVPSVAAFSGVHSKPLIKVGCSGSVSAGTGSTRVLRTSWPRTRRSMTRLRYISGADHDHTAHKQVAGSSWWTSIFGGEPSSASDQYLDYLEKRYNRIMYDGETNSQGFSVMKWLHQNANKETETAPQREEDALYVLGVANLASKKFLQKHNLPTPEENNNTGAMQEATTIDAEIVETSPVPVATLSRVFKEVGRRRELLLQKQTKGFRFAMACILRSILTGPARALQALQKLYVVGGGKKSLAMTVAAVAALSFLLRPLIRVAASEGANTMRP